MVDNKGPSKRKLMFAIILTPIFALGLIFLVLWLSLRSHNPKFHLQEFSIPGLGQTNGFQNSHIVFNVTARNPNRRVWIFYNALRGSVYYKDYRVAVEPVLHSHYYQGPKNTTVLERVFSGTMTASTVDNQRWLEFKNDLVKGTVMFSLKFTSDVKNRRSVWDTTEHRMRVKCDVGLGPDGSMLHHFRGKRCHVHFK
ncbi:hypothetical protein LWI28_021195 [Acer negundo]|uniref:Late embryogenesis abundant protein LEA-2 subgroup domain-containing protein n=1 Tax=Acer negundo TaxID=4023 RepID=A0AAD5NZR9_ACENE|nr:hypothetical protein LWI28_026215 [Acer negundo]KAI9188613.1 hypothetical protein LWI28_019299 [Acer negundo]KAI9188616.1 hypothetical protein LWI28_021195 [Acer negundo]